MKTVKKYTKGTLKGWNIRQLKNGKYVAYLGSVSQTLADFNTLGESENWIKLYLRTTK